MPGATARLLLVAAAAVGVLAGCGGTSPAGPEPWRAAHPDPSGLTFDEQAPGLCAFPVQYPDQAPAAIEYQGATYVQSARTTQPGQAPGSVIGHSADWTVSAAGGDLYVLTGPAMFQYRSETNC